VEFLGVKITVVGMAFILAGLVLIALVLGALFGKSISDANPPSAGGS
jgi:Na+-transporting methylmalonyl-CoA/oxaloacetate decarboxylase gamma subunit